MTNKCGKWTEEANSLTTFNHTYTTVVDLIISYCNSDMQCKYYLEPLRNAYFVIDYLRVRQL